MEVAKFRNREFTPILEKNGKSFLADKKKAGYIDLRHKVIEKRFNNNSEGLSTLFLISRQVK